MRPSRKILLGLLLVLSLGLMTLVYKTVGSAKIVIAPLASPLATTLDVSVSDQVASSL